MDVAVYGLATLAAVIFAVSPFLYNSHKTAAIWSVFGGIVFSALAFCLYWQKHVWTEENQQHQTEQTGPSASELRNRIYKPLYAEISGIESCLAGGTFSAAFSTTAFNSLKQNGDLELIPEVLRQRIVTVYGDAGSIWGAISALTPQVQRHVSKRITHLRTQADDAAWTEVTLRKLQEVQRSHGGISPIVNFTMSHVGRTPGWDLRNPKDPQIASPGGPTWQINDWLGFPETVTSVESLWTDTDFLYFDDAFDEWYYRITRDDLKRCRLTLLEFLKPLHSSLTYAPEYQRLLSERPKVISSVRGLKDEIAAQIRGRAAPPTPTAADIAAEPAKRLPPKDHPISDQPFSTPTFPVVEFEVSKQKVFVIHNKGRNEIEDIAVVPTEYVFDESAFNRQTLVIGNYSKVGGSLIKIPTIKAGLDSDKVDLTKLPFLEFMDFPPKDSQDTLYLRKYYSLRIVFRDGNTKKRYVHYYVTGAVKNAPSFFENLDEMAISGSGKPFWLAPLPGIIKTHQRSLYESDIEEYVP